MVSTRTMSIVSVSGESLNVPDATPSSSRVMKSPTHERPQENPSKSPAINLQQLPPEILEKILSYLPHRAIGQMRLVSRKMDAVCGGILNSKFQCLQTRMLARFQAIKSKMPRRESARRNHPLACESDIIETLHMRLTLLQMTFGKHIERKHCCFFAGEILDECYRILRYVKSTQKLGRPYKVTDELFDLSTMAMEYFKEHIEPTLPEIAYFSTDFLEFTSTPFTATTSNLNCLTPQEEMASYMAEVSKSTGHYQSFETTAPAQSNMVLRKRIKRIRQGMKRCNNQLTYMRRDLRTCKSKIAEQQKQILDYSTRLDDHDKKHEETQRKFSTLLQELNKCKTELQYYRSRAPITPVSCSECGSAIVSAPTEDLAALANQGILPEGWPDLNCLLPNPESSNQDWDFEQVKDDGVVNRSIALSKVSVKDTKSTKKKSEGKSSGSKKRRLSDATSSIPAAKKVRRVLKPRVKQA